jgi:hypothetical protein
MSTQRFCFKKPSRPAFKDRMDILLNDTMSETKDPPTRGSGEVSRFQFVGGASINEGDAYLRRRVRQHVMRDYMQKARALGAWVDPQRALERWKASRPLFTPPRALGSPSTRAVGLASKSGDNSNSLGLAQNAGFGPSAGTPTDFTRLLPEGTSIQTFLEIGRMDPFAAYPIEFSSIEYQILDFR